MSSTAHAGAVLTIDLAAIARNYSNLREHAAGAECAALVKANAYGVGVDHVAPALLEAGCRKFFVSTLDEAVELRQIIGSDPEIFVLNGLLKGDAAACLAHQVIPVLNDLGQIRTWAKHGAETERTLPAVVHVDTGMSRLGLPDDEVTALIEDPSPLEKLDVRYVMSHLVSAEEPENPVNTEQLNRFNSVLAALAPHPASLANSSGIFLGPAYHFDLVRPGVALYGINPQPSHPNTMAEVVQLKANILQVRFVDSPQTVGYGATHRVAGQTKIATLPVGYADGYLRSLGGRGYCYLGGVRVPIVGRVSMDLITLDVTAVPPEYVRPGAEVDIIGGPVSIDSLAEAAGTIGYEILTALGSRYRRHYVTDFAEK